MVNHLLLIFGLFSIHFSLGEPVNPSKCLPQCCPVGKELGDDRQCVKSSRGSQRVGGNFKKVGESFEAECGFQYQDFYPKCSDDGTPEVVTISPKDVTSSVVTNTLGSFTLNHRSDSPIHTFYNIPSTPNLSPIPSSFCVSYHPGDVQVKSLVCPSVKFSGTAKVPKCCPFGQELHIRSAKDFLCVPAAAHRRWHLRLNGHDLQLQDLIRFPYANVIFDDSRSELKCKEGKRIFFDQEAFILEQHGNLTFTRFSGEVMKSDFCVDMANVLEKQGAEVVREHKYLMTALFCLEEALLKRRQDLAEVLLNYEKVTSGSVSLEKYNFVSFLVTVTFFTQITRKTHN